MRTLIVSDLHLGAHRGRDVLRRPAAMGALLDAIGDCDRLVLLGDVVELAEGDADRALARSEGALRAIGARADGRPVIFVPGNHDHELVRAWLHAHRPDVAALDGRVPRDATPALRSLCDWLGDDVEVRYPGVWLRDDVWATHGHYLDRHLLPTGAYGIARGRIGRQPGPGSTPADYEFAGSPSLARLEGRVVRRVPLFGFVVSTLRSATMPGAPGGHHIARVVARLLHLQVRRAAIPALGRVIENLDVRAAHVVFGHVHRLGPVAGDDPDAWRTDAGTRIVNSGSWAFEPALARSGPYRPGGAVIVDDDGPPRAVALL